MKNVRRVFGILLRAILFWLPLVVLVFGMIGIAAEVFLWFVVPLKFSQPLATGFIAMVTSIGALQSALAQIEQSLGATRSRAWPTPEPPASLPPPPPPGSAC